MTSRGFPFGRYEPIPRHTDTKQQPLEPDDQTVS